MCAACIFFHLILVHYWGPHNYTCSTEHTTCHCQIYCVFLLCSPFVVCCVCRQCSRAHCSCRHGVWSDASLIHIRVGYECAVNAKRHHRMRTGICGTNNYSWRTITSAERRLEAHCVHRCLTPFKWNKYYVGNDVRVDKILNRCKLQHNGHCGTMPCWCEFSRRAFIVLVLLVAPQCLRRTDGLTRKQMTNISNLIPFQSFGDLFLVSILSPTTTAHSQT